MESTIIDVRVSVRASKNEVVGIENGKLKVRIAAAPVDGEANRALAKLLSRFFQIPISSVELIAGEASRNKKVRIPLAASDVASLLNG